jgi:putative spermidine/putrescine transport system substrate-binding protein
MENMEAKNWGRLLAAAEGGTISRRRFVAAVGAALALPLALRSTMSFAQAKELVLVNWGGDAMTAYAAAYGEKFTEVTGVAVKMDGSGPTEGAITAQAKSGNVAWDIVDADPFSAITLGKQGLLQPIDYSVVDKAKTREGFGWEHAMSAYFFSYVIAYDSELYPEAPTSMADFFDVAKFPGSRAMYKWGVSSWEAALLADGATAANLYPLDVEKAHAKISAFKEHVVSFWGGGAESQTAMLSGEASMGIVWSTRAKLIEEESNGRIKYIWDQGLLSPGAMAVLANNPAGRETAMAFLASMQDPEKQLVMFEKLGQGPANPAADALIPADQRRHNCVAPDNMARQISLDMEWYAENYSAALDQYLAMISA